jgi:hypothetical protein
MRRGGRARLRERASNKTFAERRDDELRREIAERSVPTQKAWWGEKEKGTQLVFRIRATFFDEKELPPLFLALAAAALFLIHETT